MQLPPYLSISGGVLSDAAPALSTGEQASIGPMAPARLAEFSQGRMHARIALARLGLADASIPVAADRAPVWPQGFVGSISHAPFDPSRNQCGQVMAVVARSCDCACLGVDVERTDKLRPEDWGTFLTACEMESLASRPVAQRSTVAHAIWSAKEATMKASRQVLDPQDIDIRLGDEVHIFVAEFGLPGIDRLRLSGQIAHADGWVATLVMSPRPPSHSSNDLVSGDT